MRKRKNGDHDVSESEAEQQFSKLFENIRRILVCRLRELEEAARGPVTPEQGPQEAVAALERLARKEEVLELGDRLAIFAYQEHGQPLVLMSEGTHRVLHP
jgi:hypothetical protein